MKVVLLAIIVQVVAPEPDKPPSAPQVMTSVVAEFDSTEACLNAAKGLGVIGGKVGFGVAFGCAPKDLAKLEVEKPKAPAPRASPSSHQAANP